MKTKDFVIPEKDSIIPKLENGGKYRDFMVTCVLNPFSPFDEFESWYKLDRILNWNTCETLARLVPFNVYADFYSQEMKDYIIYRTMKYMEQIGPGFWKVVSKKDYKKRTNYNKVPTYLNPHFELITNEKEELQNEY